MKQRLTWKSIKNAVFGRWMHSRPKDSPLTWSTQGVLLPPVRRGDLVVPPVYWTAKRSLPSLYNTTTPTKVPPIRDDGYVVGELVGRRIWTVDRHTGLFLSTYASYVWLPDGEEEAYCSVGCTNVPNEHCTCGFYAYKPDSIDLDGISLDGAILWGEVLLYGRFIEAEHGYRAQFARLHRINRTLFLAVYNNDQVLLERVLARYPDLEVVDSWDI